MLFKNGLASLALVSILTLTAFGQDAGKGSAIELAGGKLTIQAPETWKKVQPKSNIIQYEFRAPADAKEDQQARITIMPAGGSVPQNIDRWKTQFDGLKDEDAKVEEKEIAGQKVHFVDIKGTYKDSMGGGPFAGGQIKKMPNYRMLGLIIDSKDAGLTFIKLTGPGDVVEKLVDDWKKMADAMKAK